jgi:curved DNA-binding protein CbpA
MKDFYYILGVDANCAVNDIRSAYKKLSKKFHPDLNQNDKYFESHFREINEAYKTLSDPVKRERYDAALRKYKTNTTEKERTRHQYHNNPAAEAPNPDAKYSTTGINIGFTLILFLLTIVFGFYVYRSVSKTKANGAKQVEAAGKYVYYMPRRHKKKHLKAPTKAENNALVVALKDTSKLIAAKPAQVVAQAPAGVMPETDKPLYTTSISSNLTGVINMRKLDKFNSEIIATIPTNSKVMVMAKGDVYYKVLFNNNEGYVPKWALLAK